MEDKKTKVDNEELNQEYPKVAGEEPNETKLSNEEGGTVEENKVEENKEEGNKEEESKEEESKEEESKVEENKEEENKEEENKVEENKEEGNKEEENKEGGNKEEENKEKGNKGGKVKNKKGKKGKKEEIKKEENKVEENKVKEDKKAKSKEKQKNNDDKKKKKQKTIALIVASYMGIAGFAGFAGYVIGEDAGRYAIVTFRDYKKSTAIAKLNGKKIDSTDLKYRMDVMGEMNKTYNLDEETLDQIEGNLIEYIITTEAVYEDCKDEVEVSEEEFKSHYEKLMGQVYSSLGVLNEQEFLKKFKMSKSYLEEAVKKELVVSKKLTEVTGVTEEELKSEYEKDKEAYNMVRASHIIITPKQEGETEGLTEEEAKKKAEDLLKQIKEGANFEELAKANSMDSTAETGGDLDFFGKGEMVEEFEEAVFSLEKGELYPEVLKTQFGYHIIKKTDEKESPLEDVSAKIESALAHNKQDVYLKGLLGGDKVEVLYGIGKGKELAIINHEH